MVTDLVVMRVGLTLLSSFVQKEVTVMSAGSTPVPLQVRVKELPAVTEVAGGSWVISEGRTCVSLVSM